MKRRFPYVKLREQPDGSWRPRFEPGPRERALGFQALDLRRADGTWFNAAQLEDWSIAKHKEIEAARGGRFLPRRFIRPRKHGRLGSYVYFMVAGDWVKIGFSTNPLLRLKQVLSLSPLEVTSMVAVKASPADERRLHTLFARQRRRGEWFEVSPRIRRLILSVVETGQMPCAEQMSDRATCDTEPASPYVPRQSRVSD